MDRDKYLEHIQKTLDDSLKAAKKLNEGAIADYIPELANADVNKLSASIVLSDGSQVSSGDVHDHYFTLQSVAKLIPLIGLIEEYGEEKVFSWIHAEPSGHSFSSVAQVDKFDTIPANPMVNAGAITLCGRIPGDTVQRTKWLDNWVTKLFGAPLEVNGKVLSSERLTGDRNRSIAYLLKSKGDLILPVDDVLETYFYLCSYESDILKAAHLPMLLANGGLLPNSERIISERTSNIVVSIMATCGLYDESGLHLVNTGMPAKSGVSGLIVALATGRGGIAVSSPLLNEKGGSVKGHHVLQKISTELDWHFAAPWGYLRITDDQ